MKGNNKKDSGNLFHPGFLFKNLILMSFKSTLASWKKIVKISTARLLDVFTVKLFLIVLVSYKKRMIEPFGNVSFVTEKISLTQNFVLNR